MAEVLEDGSLDFETILDGPYKATIRASMGSARKKRPDNPRMGICVMCDQPLHICYGNGVESPE